MNLSGLRKAVRPFMLWVLAAMIGPLALATGLLEAFVPGAGVKFATGFKAYMDALPAEFWLFAGASYGVYSVSRSFGQDKKAETAEVYADLARDKQIEQELR